MTSTFPPDPTEVDVAHLVSDWVESCRRKGQIARNTYAVGLVILDTLRSTCPIDPAEILSSGGEIKGARSNLPVVLEKYGIPRTYLKEVTTRQGPQDGQRLLQILEFGNRLKELSAEKRDQALLAGIAVLVAGINTWLTRQHLKVSCPRAKSPASWISAIISLAEGRSGGIVEQHLVGAKLEERFPAATISNLPGHAADLQTSRHGDFIVGTTVYHVTAAPSPAVIEKCRQNIDQDFHPCLLVPSDRIDAATQLASLAGLDDQITIVSIEHFVALNVVELASGEKARFLEVLNRIVETYNRRLKEVETDMSLRIEIS